MAFGPGLLGYGVAFVLTRVLFAVGDVRHTSLLMIGAAVAGVMTMGLMSWLLPTGERAAALAIGYGVAQTVAAVLLMGRVHHLSGSMGHRVVGRLLGEALLGGTAAAGAMLAVGMAVPDTRWWSVVELPAGGLVGVAVFAGVLAALRRDQVAGWLRARRAAG